MKIFFNNRKGKILRVNYKIFLSKLKFFLPTEIINADT